MFSTDLGGKEYTLGKGRVFFDRFAQNAVVGATTRGEGYRYLGNTPEFSTSSSAENLDHFSAEGGVRTKDDSVQLSLDRTGSMTCDNISTENLALVLLGSSSTLVQASGTAVQEVFTAAKRGRIYQLGVSPSTPTGVRKVSNVVVKKGASWVTTVAASGNYEVDLESGQVLVFDNAAAINNEDIQITYDVAASTREQVISGTNSIYGALLFKADNPKGKNRDFLLPYVKLAPDGDYALKGEEWQTIGFTFEILTKASNIAAMYIDGQAVVTP